MQAAVALFSFTGSQAASTGRFLVWFPSRRLEQNVWSYVYDRRNGTAPTGVFRGGAATAVVAGRVRLWTIMIVVANFIASTVAVLAPPGVAHSQAAGIVPTSGVVTRLAALGIVDGFPGGGVGFEKAVSRAELAALVLRLQGDRVAPKPRRMMFADVPAEHWAAGYIAEASTRGLLNGYPGGTFRPDASVSQAETVTALLRAIGYAGIEGRPWPGNYIDRAAQVGLTRGLPVDPAAPATRGWVFTVLDRALRLPLGAITGQKSGGTGTDTPNTPLSRYLGVAVYDKEWAERTGRHVLPYVNRVPSDRIGELAPNEITLDVSPGKRFRVSPGINPDDYAGERVEVWVRGSTVLYMERDGDERVLHDEIAGDVIFRTDDPSTRADESAVVLRLRSAGQAFSLLNRSPVTPRNPYGFRGVRINYGQDGMAFPTVAAFAQWLKDTQAAESLDGAHAKLVLAPTGQVLYADIQVYTGKSPWDDVAHGQPVLIRAVDAQRRYVQYADWAARSGALQLGDAALLVTVNGVPSTLEELRPGDLLHVFQQGPRQYYLQGIRRRVAGTLAAALDSQDEAGSLAGVVVVDGRSIPLGSNATLSAGGGEAVEPLTKAMLDGLTGTQVELFLDARGVVRHVWAEDSPVGHVGVITESPRLDQGEWQFGYVTEQGLPALGRVRAESLRVVLPNGEVPPRSDDPEDPDSIPENVEALFIRYDDTTPLSAAASRLVAFEYKHSEDAWEVHILNPKATVLQNTHLDMQAGVVRLPAGEVLRVTPRTLFFDVSGDVTEIVGGGQGLPRYGVDHVDRVTWEAVAAKHDVTAAYESAGDELRYLFVLAAGGAALGSGVRFGVVEGVLEDATAPLIRMVKEDGSRAEYVYTERDRVGTKDFVLYRLEDNGDRIQDLMVLARFYNLEETRRIIRDELDLASVGLDTIALLQVARVAPDTVWATNGVSFRVGSNTVYFDLDRRAPADGVSVGDVVVLVDTADIGPGMDYVAIVEASSARNLDAEGYTVIRTRP